MLRTILKSAIALSILVLCIPTTYAGNEDRIGAAGASELLVNPWARSTAFGTAGVASIQGIEAQFGNIAGLAFTDKTQIKFDYTNWLGDAGISLSSAGIAQRVGDNTVLGVSLQTFGYGEIQVTTADLPEGGIGTFTPRNNIINLGVAHSFSNSIYVGFNMKVVTEHIANLRASGIAFDAGVQYVTGKKKQIRFGITLKNVGTPMRFKGDGLDQQIYYQSTNGQATLLERSSQFQMPSLLALGFSYDFIFNKNNSLLVAAAFHANSFTHDQFNIGLDYSLRFTGAAIHIRAGFVAEKALFDKALRTTSLTGLTAGVSVDALLGENKIPLGVEYAVRTSSPFGIINTFGIALSLK